MSTVRAQRAVYGELEPVWNGALEREGKAPGLSNYSGRSSIFQSPNWERLDALLHGEAKGTVRGHDRNARAAKYDPARDAAILASLKRGASYGAITRALHVTPGIVRRVGRLNGITRVGFNQHKRRSAA